ncbi:MAG: response regulator [Ignavibacteriales bacterium]|nr:response regulator [Ignavibacteriales bacterium]
MAVPQEFHHIRERFKDEVEQHLTDAGVAVRQLNPGDNVLLDRIARHLHAIKGSAPIVGARPLSAVARAAEESVLLLTERPELWNPAREAALLEAFEFMKVQVHEYVDGKTIDDGGQMIQKLREEFPGAEEAAKRVKADISMKVSAPAVTGTKPSGPKRKILFVDDSQIARELYKVFLVNRGFDVDTAADGNDALEQLRKNRYDLVVTDDQMPNMDGTELLRMCRSDASLKTIPFVVISGKANEEARSKAMEWGAASYLVKGDFEKEHLLEVIGDVLSR